MSGGTISVAVFGLLACIAAWAQESDAIEGGYYGALAYGADEVDSQDLTAELGLPLGERGWLHVGLGSSRTSLNTGIIDTRVAALTAGFDAGRVEMAGSYAYRDDGDAFTQHDLIAQLTWRAARGYAGIELFYRSADAESVASIERRRGDPLSIRIEESIEGTGVGARAGIQLAQSVEVFASGMTYDYENTTNRPALFQRLPTLQLSGISREEAFLESTWTIGTTLSIRSVAVTASFTRDRSALLQEITDTSDLTLDIPLSDRWNVAPQIGYSDSDFAGGITFGSVHLSVVW
jgi:hypothetical protein